MGAVVRIGAAPTLPLSTAEMQAHLRALDDTLTGQIQNYQRAAVDEFEDVSGVALVSSTFDFYLDGWPRGNTISLPKGPVSAVASVKYTPEGGSPQTLDPAKYLVDLASKPARITLITSADWPGDNLATNNAIVVRFSAGWADPSVVPADIKTALLCKIQWLFDGGDNRDGFLDRLERLWVHAVERHRIWT